MGIRTYVYVTSTFIGFHRWGAAPDEVAFLRDYHRHVFYVKLAVNVSHGDRDVEFFILKRELDHRLREHFEECQFELSCEQIAETLIGMFITMDYNVHSCEVSEDGENGAVVVVTP